MRVKKIICECSDDDDPGRACSGEVRRFEGMNLCAAHIQECKDFNAECYLDDEYQVNPTPVDYYHC